MTGQELRDQIAALFRWAPGETPLHDETPGEIADAVLTVVRPRLDEQTEIRAFWEQRADRAEARQQRLRNAWASARRGRARARILNREQQSAAGANLRMAVDASNEAARLREALGRVRDLATAARLAGCGAGWTLNPADVLAALDQAPAATP